METVQLYDGDSGKVVTTLGVCPSISPRFPFGGLPLLFLILL